MYTGYMKKIVKPENKTRLLILLILMLSLFVAMILIFVQGSTKKNDNLNQSVSVPQKPQPLKEPRIAVSTVVEGLKNPWDIVFLPDGTPAVSERSGQISLIKDGTLTKIASISDIYATGEGGLTGMTLDTDFGSNRYIYTCFNAKSRNVIDVRLVRWTVAADNSGFNDRKDVITGIPSNKSGRHSGCRVRSESDGTLWVGTGDAATASNPQDPKSLGGKILHVSREGASVEGNLAAPFDQRIFSYGHRNVQGLALFDTPKDGAHGFSIEHGSDVDDEVNLLKPGNFGWAPKSPYIEGGVPMTDKHRFPDAVEAIWSSGTSTIAPSGATILKGEQWGSWNGSLAMAVLKDKHVRILSFDKNYKILAEKPILGEFGRVRSATLDPEGALYLTTDNKLNDKVIKVEANQ